MPLFKKLLIATSILFLTLSSAQGADSCNSAWNDRITYLEKYLGDRFNCTNGINYIPITSECYPKYGSTCRITDLSSTEKYEILKKKWHTFQDNCKARGFKYIRTGTNYYIGGKKIYDFYNTNIQFKSLLPPAFELLMDELSKAIKKGYLDDEAKNHGTFWSQSEQGYITLSIPVDYSKTKRTIGYHFLLPIEITRKINKLFKEADL